MWKSTRAPNKCEELYIFFNICVCVYVQEMGKLIWWIQIITNKNIVIIKYSKEILEGMNILSISLLQETIKYFCFRHSNK